MKAIAATVLHTGDVPAVTVSPGVEMKELTGRAAQAGARSQKASVAHFRLEPGRASHWSHNIEGEESFFVLRGHGEVWVGNRAQAVKPGSFILIPPSAVRSVRASQGEVLEYYAITSPAWYEDGHVLVEPPEGAPLD